jgi:membrane protease YdiL (CAAX protease family)
VNRPDRPREDQRPAPGWRLLIFLGGGFLAYVVAGSVVATILPAEPSLELRLVAFHGAMLLVVLVATTLMMRRFEGRPLAAVGLPAGREALGGTLRGIALGAALLAGLVGLQLAVGWIRPAAEPGSIGGWLAMAARIGAILAVASAAEEVLFRGYMFQVLIEWLGVRPAIVVGSVAFGAIHLANPSIDALPLINVTLAGALLSVVYVRTRSLWPVIGLHWAWNWTMGVPFDLPVSGLEFDMPGYDLVTAGPALWTGGGFGPEGGLLTGVALALATGWAFRTRWLRPSPGMLEVGTIIDSRMASEEGG